MRRAFCFRLLFVTIVCFVMAVPAAAAVPPPTLKAKALFNVDENWHNTYWMSWSRDSRFQQLEFYVIGPYGERMVSLDGNVFRLRDKQRIKPTIYTTKFSYVTHTDTFGWDREIKTVFLNSDGQFQDINDNSVTNRLRIVRDSNSYIVMSDVYISGWKT